MKYISITLQIINNKDYIIVFQCLRVCICIIIDLLDFNPKHEHRLKRRSQSGLSITQR